MLAGEKPVSVRNWLPTLVWLQFFDCDQRAWQDDPPPRSGFRSIAATPMLAFMSNHAH
jgi:hypothetical protein